MSYCVRNWKGNGVFRLRCSRQGEALRKADAAAPKQASSHLLMLCYGLDLPADTPGRLGEGGPALPGCCRMVRLNPVGFSRPVIPCGPTCPIQAGVSCA